MPIAAYMQLKSYCRRRETARLNFRRAQPALHIKETDFAEMINF